MNKKLLIVRHAKSDWGGLGISDFDRPLNPRGFKDAPVMGKRLFAKEIKPELMISSTALRAITTAKLIAQEIGFPEKEILHERKIYEASHQQLLKLVNDFDDDKGLIAVFGHNNGVTDLAVYLTDADIYNIPTCGMVLISFPFDHWEMVSKNTGEVLFYDYPKNPEAV